MKLFAANKSLLLALQFSLPVFYLTGCNGASDSNDPDTAPASLVGRTVTETDGSCADNPGSAHYTVPSGQVIIHQFSSSTDDVTNETYQQSGSAAYNYTQSSTDPSSFEFRDIFTTNSAGTPTVENSYALTFTDANHGTFASVVVDQPNNVSANCSGTFSFD